jgi:phage host-nuclease inhibitor protein Gam
MAGKSGSHPSKRARQDLSLSEDLSKLSDLLDSISSDEGQVKQAVALILNKENFENAFTCTTMFAPEIPTMKTEIKDLTTRVHDLEQYSRRNCLKFTGKTKTQTNSF